MTLRITLHVKLTLGMCQVNWQTGRPARSGQAGRLASSGQTGRPAHSGQAGWPARGRQARQLGAGRQAGGYKYFGYKWLGADKTFPTISYLTSYLTYLQRYNPPNHPRMLNSP